LSGKTDNGFVLWKQMIKNEFQSKSHNAYQVSGQWEVRRDCRIIIKLQTAPTVWFKYRVKITNKGRVGDVVGIDSISLKTYSR
jgi:hypothetical protein